jgi:hypothetical protein
MLKMLNVTDYSTCLLSFWGYQTVYLVNSHLHGNLIDFFFSHSLNKLIFLDQTLSVQVFYVISCQVFMTKQLKSQN